MDELEEYITKVRNKKAPGKLGVTRRAYKALSTEAKEVKRKILCNVCNKNTNPPEWHEAALKCLHRKGTDPNNGQAMCLKDMSAQLIKRILRILSTQLAISKSVTPYIYDWSTARRQHGRHQCYWKE
jgi:hypothetical protein